MRNRKIEITEREYLMLIDLKRKTASSRVMERCQAIILSSRGFSMGEIAEIFEIHRTTVQEWFDRWESGGIENMKDLPKSGRRRIFNESEEKK